MNKKTLSTIVLACFASVATAQRLGLSGNIIDCGQVMFRQPVTAVFEISNRGNKPLMITKVLTDCGCTVVDYPSQPLAKGAKSSVKVTFDAKQMGHFNKRVGIYSNASDKPDMVTVRGVVVSEITEYAESFGYKLGSLMSDADNIEFDDVNRGEHPVVKIHIKNPTSQTVEPQVMHLPNYLEAEVSPSKLAPGKQGVITFILNSNLLGDYGLTETSLYLGANPGDKISHDKEISLSAVLLPAFGKMTDQQLRYAPKIKLSETEVNIGSFGDKSKIKTYVEIENEGRTDLEISRLQLFSSGVQMSLDKTKIKPGEKAKLKITASRDGMKSARRQPRILMITNDPVKPKVMLRIVTDKNNAQQ